MTRRRPELLELKGMGYVSEWQPIRTALRQVVGSGLGKTKAKQQLCAAISDRKIGVRVILGEVPHRGLPERVLGGPELPVPPRLRPEQIDWTHSVPLIEWPLVMQRAGEPVSLFGARASDLIERKIALIEVRAVEIAMEFGRGPDRQAAAAVGAHQDKSKVAGAKARGIQQAISAL